jgi:hypothetical protein
MESGLEDRIDREGELRLTRSLAADCLSLDSRLRGNDVFGEMAVLDAELDSRLRGNDLRAIVRSLLTALDSRLRGNDCSEEHA